MGGRQIISYLQSTVYRVAVAGLLAGFLASSGVFAGPRGARPVPSPLTIPRVDRAPNIEDFLDMKPSPAVEGRLAKVDQFLQNRPSDGQPSSQRTEAYLGYDDKNLYVVFICFDSEPHRLRARMVSREQFVSDRGDGIDDTVSVSLDTFRDLRRGFVFQANAYGIQWDALFSENGGFDSSFDTVWHSEGRITGRGFVVWIALPFKSLRFSPAEQQTWGILLNRDIPRNNEVTFWPHFSARISGYFNQAAELNGLQKISPGRNMQFVPYGSFRSFRAPDARDPLEPRYNKDPFDGNAGLDAKFVLKDSLALDITANPDFGQVESDEPQITANERFEVFFPEKRPFFLENASFFRTPNNLVFTRRIADPRIGARLTGKVGRTTIGALLVDDQSPGKRVPSNDPLADSTALFGVLRVSRDIFQESSIGIIFTDREYRGAYNRVGGVDGRFKLSPTWTAQYQAAASATRDAAGNYLAGPAYDAILNRRGRQLGFNARYTDRATGFRTLTGFLPRPDIRRIEQSVSWNWRPEGKHLISWGPRFGQEHLWDHSGQRLGNEFRMMMNFEFRGQTGFGLGFFPEYEFLRPGDAPGITQTRVYRRDNSEISFRSDYFRKVGFDVEYIWGQRINTDPAPGLEPELADRSQMEAALILRPFTALRIDNSYLFFRLKERASRESIFNNHIVRSKWNWQFTRELSLRLIFEYDALLANQTHTTLETEKNFNADFLITYLVHPGTAVYVGYNSNLQNQNIVPCDPNDPADAASGCRSKFIRDTRFRNDAKGFFVKVSYLFRF